MKDNDFDSLKVTSSLIETAGMIGAWYIGYLSLDTFSQQVFTCGPGEFTPGLTADARPTTQKVGGTEESLTGVGIIGGAMSIAGSSTSDPDFIVEVFTPDQQAYSEVDKRAKTIYDKYDKNHIKEKDEGTLLIVNNKENIKLMNDILSTKSKTELLIALSSLEETLKKDDNSNDKGNCKTLKRKK